MGQTGESPISNAALRPESGEVSRISIGGWDVFRFGQNRAEVLSNLKGRWAWMDLDAGAEDDVPSASASRRIRVKANRFFDLIDFQFGKTGLVSIRLRPSPRRFTWLTLRKTLAEKYGESDAISFDQAIWTRGTSRLVLERDGEMRYFQWTTNTAPTPAAGPPSADEEWTGGILKSF